MWHQLTQVVGGSRTAPTGALGDEACLGEGALRWTGLVWGASRVSVTPLARMQGGTWRVRASAGFVLARVCVCACCTWARLCVVRLALGFSMLFVGAAICVGAYE